MKILILLLVSLVCQAYAAPSTNSKILKTLQTKKSANVIVSIKGNNVAALRNQFSINTQSFTTRSQKITSLYSILKDHADTTQTKILNVLNQQKFKKPIVVRQLWISNEIIVRNADLSVVEKLLSMDEVTEVREELVFPLQQRMNKSIIPDGHLSQVEEIQWGVEAIHAPEVWATGNKGAGVVIGITDSGVRATHEALRDGYRKEYGWFDPYKNTEIPYDNLGHGTSIAGIVAGRTKGIGVAPEAQWTACMGCDYDVGCTETGLLECSQWHLCPTDPQGNNPDCSKAPNAVSNSWGMNGGFTFYDDILAAWKAANIGSFFAIGNDGRSGCGYGLSPADAVDAIAVGAVTIDNEVTYFSSTGPTKIGKRIKPDISAPGADITSAGHLSDTTYITASGTSEACPHVSGLAALLYSENPNLTYNQIKDAVIAGAQHTNSLNKDCAGVSDTEYPNNHVGYGSVDALASLNHIKKGL